MGLGSHTLVKGLYRGQKLTNAQCWKGYQPTCIPEILRSKKVNYSKFIRCLVFEIKGEIMSKFNKLFNINENSLKLFRFVQGVIKRIVCAIWNKASSRICISIFVIYLTNILGVGLRSCTTFSIGVLPDYYDRYLLLASGVAFSGISIGPAIFAPLTQVSEVIITYSCNQSESTF